MRDRDEVLDSVRGIGILLVVLGHLLQDGLLFRLIYACHMPLFFVVSSVNYRRGNSLILDIEKKFFRLFVPFVAWMFVPSLLNGKFNFMEVFLIHIKSPDNGMWFFYVLFLCDFLLRVSDKFNTFFVFFLLPFVYIIMKMIGEYKYGLDMILIYLPIYTIGVRYNQKKSIAFKFLPLIVVLFVTSEIIFSYTEKQILKYVTGITLYIVLYDVLSVRSKLLAYIGKCSLGIYVIHFYMLEINTKIQNVFFSFIMIVCLSVIVYEVLNKNKVLNIIFFGGYKKSILKNFFLERKSL